MFYLILISALLFVTSSGIQTTDGRPRAVAGYSVMRVATGSMVPELPINTLIVTRQVEPSDLEEGQIITVLRDDVRTPTVTHRIHEIYENHDEFGRRAFRLIGDWNGIPDPEIDLEENLVGRVVMSSYTLGRALMFVHEHFLTIVRYAIIIVIVLFVFKVFLTPKGQKEEARDN